MADTTVGSNQQEWWTEYYSRMYSAAPTAWLDLSNEEVQAQIFAVAIEAAGAIEGRRCLDVGCGHGQLSTGLAGLRAIQVVGVDIIPETIISCREKYPHIRWECGGPSDQVFVESLGTFDRIFLVEVLQYVDWESTLRTLWDSVRPGGRIVAVVPNKDNAIVQNTMARFHGMYLPPSPSELAALVASLPDVDFRAFRGIDFQQDQRLVPYLASPWVTTGELHKPANRLNFAIKKES
jgi:2-polyprenyl-3-methyl-5-hydroxy-6-metoxy-1,4-benzoquinol methylase